MKGKLCLLILVALFATGCVSTPSDQLPVIVYKEASEVTAATLVLKGEGTSISYFDGEAVNWTVPTNYSSLRIKVPYGRHKFIMVNAVGEEEILEYLSLGDEYEISGEAGKKLSITRQPAKSTGTSTGSTYVKGYYRKNGTYVRGHYRRRK
jgi:hypothetical protein